MIDVEWYDFDAPGAPQDRMRRGKLLKVGSASSPSGGVSVAYVITPWKPHDQHTPKQRWDGDKEILIVKTVKLEYIRVLGEHIPLFEPGEIR